MPRFKIPWSQELMTIQPLLNEASQLLEEEYNEVIEKYKAVREAAGYCYQEIKASLEQLNDKINAILSAIAMTKQENDAILHEMEVGREKLSKLEVLRNTLIESLNTLKANAGDESIDEQIAALEAEIANVYDQMEAVQDYIGELNGKLAENGKYINELEKQLEKGKRLYAELNQMYSEYLEKDQAIAEYISEIDYDNKMKSLNVEIARMADFFNRLTSKAVEIESQE